MERDRVSIAVWRQNEPIALELAVIDSAIDGFALQGDVVVASNPMRVSYDIAVTEAWETTNVSIEVKPGLGPTRRIELRSSAMRRWSVHRSTESEWSSLPELDGLIDIDLGCTPATNLLPIRRLNLAIGESMNTTAVWVTFPSLDIAPLPQRYTRLGDREYLYESFLSGFRANLIVDAFGVVDRYSDIWIRLKHETERVL